jgi:hypothetical protein
MVEKVTGVSRENTCGEGNWSVQREHMVEKVTGVSRENTWWRR